MRINNNIMAMNAHRQLGINSRNQGKSIEKLSSGMRINRAGDDAAGLAISEKMRSQVRGLNQASRNAQDDISMIQTAEGALQETHSIIHRMREMAVQSANDSNTDDDRAQLQKEMDQLAKEVTRISNDTEFNTRKLINGNLEAGSGGDEKITFHIGANKGQNMEFNIGAMDAKTLNLTSGGASTPATASKSVGASDVSAGPNVTSADNTLTINLNGGGAQTLTLAETDHADGQSLVDDINAKIQGNGTLKDKVVASLDKDNHVVFTAVDEGQGSIAVAGNAATTHLGVQTATNGTDKVIPNDSSTAASFGAGGAEATVQQGIDITSQEAANDAIEVIDKALKTVSGERAKLGAAQNRLEHTIKNVDTAAENLQASESRIRDVDMAKEMMNYTKNNILSQAAQSMLAQANQAPQGVLQLLR